MTVESAMLRAAVGEPGYRRLESIARELDELASLGVIDHDGVGLIIEALAREIIAQSVAREVANDLSALDGGGDTDDPPGRHTS